MKHVPPLLTGPGFSIDRVSRSGDAWSVEATVGGVKRHYRVLGSEASIIEVVSQKAASPFEIRLLKSNLSS